MPKTIAITPSWYWPENIDRVAGIPPYALHELCIGRHARHRPDEIAIYGADQRVSYSELQQKVRDAAAAVRTQVPGAGTVVVGSELSADNLALLLGALAAGVHVRIVGSGEEGGAVASELGAPLVNPEVLGQYAGSEGAEVVTLHSLLDPAVTIPGRRGPVTHSHRSLMAMAVSLITFLDPLPESPWLSACALDRWEGLAGALIPLFRGLPLVTAGGMDVEAMLAQVAAHRPAYALLDLDVATLATRESRRGIRGARDVLAGMILATTGVFDPGDRQRVAKSFRCSALTIYGIAETGPIFAAHPQWYIDESVGIPITNAHVVPADPRNGTPIQALWEQVESAEVTVKGPMLMCHDAESAAGMRFIDGRYRTGVIASSDANGMIYLLPD